MKANHETVLADFLSLISAEWRDIFAELADYAISLGCTPKRTKTKDITIDFFVPKAQRAIMKFEVKEQKHDGYTCGERNVPGLRLKYFASKGYSRIFEAGVKRVIEEFDGKYAGCYGCGNCENEPRGYTYTYPDGKKLFRCGRELISIFDFSRDDIPEMERLLKAQFEYYRAGNR